VQIERQLDLLDKFWDVPENAEQEWQNNSPLQAEYYSFIKSHGFVEQEAPRPAKDARQKTSGLADIGLIDNQRRLTKAGRSLLDIARSGSFARDNLLQIPADSFIFLKQMLKTSNSVEGDIVRPFMVVSYALLKLGYISNEEFAYLLPLCTNRKNTEIIIKEIGRLRDGFGSPDEIILSRLMAMDNYKNALDYFLSGHVTEDVITSVGMNRKSPKYDNNYFPFYQALHKVALEKDSDSVMVLFNASRKLFGKTANYWRKYLFNTLTRSVIEREGLSALKDTPLLQATSEDEFKRLFFEQMHLFKARATLGDYFDLNRRYFKTTDTMIFADGKVIFDVLPHCWLHSTEDNLLDLAFSHADNLADAVDLHKIASFLAIDEQRLYTNLKILYNITVDNVAEANRAIDDERYKRFNAMIDKKFNRKILMNLLKKFERREDEAIRQAVTNNATIPTIFEYILGIAWYLISDRQGDILSYMNLSLEADLLPRSHATGGNADIEYIYEKTDAYPEHTLLIEATLSDGTAQRRMEMEPVSRHLGEHILSSNNTSSYCVFVSTFLHRNVISDFRNRRTYQYYSDQYENVVDGLKILPLATAELRTILERNIKYEEMYRIFETAYHSNEPIPTWYEQEIAAKL
jgi:hypothetical protein